jgi:hypothetical protein
MTIWSGFRGKSGRDSREGDMAVEAGVWEYLAWTFSNVQDLCRLLLLSGVIVRIAFAIIHPLIKSFLYYLNKKQFKFNYKRNKFIFKSISNIITIFVTLITLFYTNKIFYERYIISKLNGDYEYRTSDLYQLYLYLSDNSIIDIFRDIPYFIYDLFMISIALLIILIVLFWPYPLIMIWMNYKNGLRGMNIFSQTNFEKNSPKLEGISLSLGLIFMTLLTCISLYIYY